MVCHGAKGDGAGPAALALNPRPSDFTQHMVPGRHTDGQIFLWIRDGYPRTAMPAWGARLSEEQIWQLVVYVRAFGQDATVQTTVAAQPIAAPTAVSTVQPATTPTNLNPLPPLIFVRQGSV
jgi:mono/diheme cytochrome c family protein